MTSHREENRKLTEVLIASFLEEAEELKNKNPKKSQMLRKTAEELKIILDDDTRDNNEF